MAVSEIVLTVVIALLLAYIAVTSERREKARSEQVRAFSDRLLSACDMTLEARKLEIKERKAGRKSDDHDAAPRARAHEPSTNGTHNAPVRIPDFLPDPLE